MYMCVYLFKAVDKLKNFGGCYWDIFGGAIQKLFLLKCANILGVTPKHPLVYSLVTLSRSNFMG